MPVQKIDVTQFLALAKEYPVLDVRSEGEYVHAHFPGALSLPLFTNEERKVVGTAYKQQSREEAIKIGLRFFGVKMVEMVEAVEKLVVERPNKNIVVHCWRGGMRSAGVAWLLDLYGFKVYSLVGGYKAFRQWAVRQFEVPYPFKILGGYTGTGKTFILQELQKKGEVTIDLEGLAGHKGSAFGNIGLPVQPTQEMFENSLALVIYEKTSVLGSKFIWLEDESQRIGSVNIPAPLWRQMRSAQVTFLDVPFEERLLEIMKGYGSCEKEKLVNAIMRIQKRLGGLETKTAINFLLENNYKDCFAVLLKYYDKLYLKGLDKREDPTVVVDKIGVEKIEYSRLASDVILRTKETTAQQL
ncbi:MAG: tRNA 2-selenouridine(34) synthase MnmH [Segetibacter sp.]|nr:tRNA 2-selenouridine(34) synthase MnmH [Segetibacter sp.]